MVMGDGDDEELEEEEVKEAIEAHASKRTAPITPLPSTGGEAAEAEPAVGGSTTAGAESGAAALVEAPNGGSGTGGGAPETEAAASAADVPMTSSAAAAAAPSARKSKEERLWSTAECRERWQRAVREVVSSATLSVAIRALHVHCAAFGVLVTAAAKSSGKLDERDVYYHAAAFLEVRKKVKRARN
jgi:hypothetical protein